MSWLLDSARNLIGVGGQSTTAPARKPNSTIERRKQAAKDQSHGDRLAALIRAENLRIGALQSEISDKTAEIDEFIKKNQNTQAKATMMEKRQLESTLVQKRARLANLTAQQNAVSQANGNLEHALLVSEGAEELESATSAMEQIDLTDAVNRMQEADNQLAEHNDILSQPMFTAGTAIIDPDDVDAEFEAMLEARRDQELLNVLDGTTTPMNAAGVSSGSGKSQKENLKNEF